MPGSRRARQGKSKLSQPRGGCQGPKKQQAIPQQLKGRIFLVGAFHVDVFRESKFADHVESEREKSVERVRDMAIRGRELRCQMFGMGKDDSFILF